MALATSTGVSTFPLLQRAATDTSTSSWPATTPVPDQPRWTAGQSTLSASSAASNGCDLSGHRLVYAGLNSWLPAEPNVKCPDH
jgi:hypothetical protein